MDPREVRGKKMGAGGVPLKKNPQKHQINANLEHLKILFPIFSKTKTFVFHELQFKSHFQSPHFNLHLLIYVVTEFLQIFFNVIFI